MRFLKPASTFILIYLNSVKLYVNNGAIVGFNTVKFFFKFNNETYYEGALARYIPTVTAREKNGFAVKLS